MGLTTIDYGSWSDLTIGLDVTPLASSATLVAGRESTARDNTSTLADDYLVAGTIRTGTSPTAGKIEVWAYGEIGSTPDYPDAITGSDGDRTLNSVDIKHAALKLVKTLITDATARNYYFGPTSIAGLFGQVPPRWGVFVTHNTVAALDTDAADHRISSLAIKFNNP